MIVENQLCAFSNCLLDGVELLSLVHMCVMDAVLKQLWTSCFSPGGANFIMAFTFFGQGFTPRGGKILPKYSICCCLTQHLSGLNFSPALWALCTASRRSRSLRSSEDPWTLTSSAQGNVPGIPSSALSICSQKISAEILQTKRKALKTVIPEGCIEGCEKMAFLA